MTPDPEHGITDESTLSDLSLEDDTTRWRWLERWNAAVFFVAGILLSVFVVVTAIRGVTDMTGVWIGVAEVGSGVLGLIAGIIGVVSLYPRLRDRAPRLSRGGIWAVGAAVIGIVVTIGWLLVIGIPESQGEDVPTALTLLFVLSVILIALGFLLFAAASLRTHTPSRLVGLLLLVPVVMWIIHYVVLAIVGSIWTGTVIDYTVIAVAFLTLGYLLHTRHSPTDRAESSPTEVRHG